jgi:hypothetical protein
LPRGRQLVTLEGAGNYITKLPKAEQDLKEWQTAIGCLIGAAEGRDCVMHARIGVLKRSATASQVLQSYRAQNEPKPTKLRYNPFVDVRSWG